MSGIGIWLIEQMLGTCEAIEYLHEYISSEGESLPTRRIGFHHDLKPANILLFESGKANRPVWKLGDFGSGDVKYTAVKSTEELYNRKASTGDPVYSAPEHVVQGRVSRSKDIWSLGCIFLECLIWTLIQEQDAVKQFETARNKFSLDNPYNSPLYWCQKLQGKPYLNPEVVGALQGLDDSREVHKNYKAALNIVRQMLVVEPESRLNAVQLCKHFRSLQTRWTELWIIGLMDCRGTDD